ncbi:Hypothetical protein POVR1_LOCUS478 [uncultured virus]|nr:Hypothetical protein POVR1_LOCUS478 [uncultured virus]
MLRHGNLLEIEKIVTDQFSNYYDINDKLVVFESAVESGRLDVVDLIHQQMNENLTDDNLSSLLSSAVRSGKLEMVNFVKELSGMDQETWNKHLSENISFIDVIQGKNIEFVKHYLSKLEQDDLSFIISLLANVYHRNNLDIFKLILAKVPKPFTLSVLLEIFEALMIDGNLNLLRYAVHFFQLSSSDLDIIYFFTVTALDRESWYSELNKLHLGSYGDSRLGLSMTIYLDGLRETLGYLMFEMHGDPIITPKGRKIQDYLHRSPYHLPTHPGVFKWFQTHGDNKKLYEIDLAGIIATGGDASEVRNAIISYRVDPSENLVECIDLSLKKTMMRSFGSYWMTIELDVP